MSEQHGADVRLGSERHHVHRWIRSRLGAVLVAAVLVGLLEWQGAIPRAVTARGAQAAPAGYLLIQGVYLPPPYRVAFDGPRVSVNGFVVEDFSAGGSDLSTRPIDETDPNLSAADLLELATRYYAANVAVLADVSDDTPDATLAATIVYLGGLAAAPSVTDDDGLLTIADAQGGEASALLASNALVVPGADGGADAAAAAADALTAALNGVLLVRGDGGLVTLPLIDGAILLKTAADSLVQGVDPDTRAAQLIALLNDPAVVVELVANFAPDATLVARLTADSGAPPQSDPGGARIAPPGDSATLETGGGVASAHRGTYLEFDPRQHPVSETPGDRRAFIYSTVVEDTHGAPFRVAAALTAQSYTVTIVTNTAPPGFAWDASTGEFVNGAPVKAGAAPATNGAANLAQFLASASGVGAFYFESHGGRGRLGIERYGSCDDAHTALQNLYAAQGRTPAQRESAASRDGLGVAGPNRSGCYIWMSNKYIKAHWQDKDTIVYLMACYSNSTYGNGGFQAAPHTPTPATPSTTVTGPREFLGYVSPTSTDEGPIQAIAFWEQMAAFGQGDGKHRPTSLAYPAAFDASQARARLNGVPSLSRSNFVWHHRQGATDTVLSPAVSGVVPSPGSIFEVGDKGTGRALNDARLSVAPNPLTAIASRGCITILAARWIPTDGGRAAAGVEFDWLATMPGSNDFVEVNPSTISRNNDNRLDGNQNPAGADHKAPNQDDYVWTVKCKAKATSTSVTFISTPDTTQPQVAITPSPSPSPTPVPGRTQTRFELSQTSAAPGDRVGFQADGFTPSQTGTVQFDGTKVATAPIGPDGGAIGGFFVPPQALPGPHTVTFGTPPDGTVIAMLQVTNAMATSTATVTPQPKAPPSLTLVPPSAVKGQTVNFVAQGFTPGQNGQLRLDGQPAGAAFVDLDGHAQGTFQVPPAIPAGPHNVSFTTAADGAASAVLQVSGP